MKSMKFNVFLLVILGGLVILTVYLQITNADTTNKTVVSLFNILQLIISLSFSWILSRVTARDEFRQSQKEFAIAAYRRINEIDKGVDRLISRTRKQLSVARDNTRKTELELILENSYGIKESIKSSIADWGDIIGTEIITMEGLKLGQTTSISESDDKKDETEQESLVESLPNSLQLQYISTEISKRELAKDQVAEMKKDLEVNGTIFLDGLWDSTFDYSVDQIAVGQVYDVCIGDVGARVSVLICRDEQKKNVAMITNNLPLSYDQGMIMLCDLLQKSEFRVQIVDIGTPYKAKKGDRMFCHIKYKTV